MRFTFKKEEKLKSKKLIGQLFKEGKSLKQYPIHMVYLKNDFDSSFPIKASFSVSKRKFKNAVDRNRIKRILREAYRKNKHLLYEDLHEKYIIMFIYVDEKEHKYVELEEKMILLIKRLKEKTNN